ncbi:hypothetical protein BROUX41_002069 [Berkeleyomyces rouxiae]|uniref:uncharacterized protein n=1 Tax=Berkeleyomyces rouxiae TaxID=2035830 RepID=UPI003B81F31C
MDPPCPAGTGIQFSDLILPHQESLSQILGDLKRTNTSISNRLRSIAQDACFVERVAASYAPRPLVANERCGSWYVDVARKAGSAYFKSTDGHTDAWKISTRRLNVHLLRIIEENDGCIIVDSTRRGKRMPDALSKTIPIWCAVINALLFPDNKLSHELHTPPAVVSASEHAQISALLSSFVETLSGISLDLPTLRQALSQPLRPLWVTPDTPLPEVSPACVFDGFRPVICCTASARSMTAGGEIFSGAGYVQGAADDTEMWAHGLTAPLFWAHREALLATPEAELPGLIAQLTASTGRLIGGVGDDLTEVIRNIFVAALPIDSTSLLDEDLRTCVVQLTPDSAAVVKGGSRLYSRGIGRHKVASRNLRTELPKICEFVEAFVRGGDGQEKGKPEKGAGEEEPPEVTAAEGADLRSGLPPTRIVIACESAKDISVGTALAISCRLYADDGALRTGSAVANDFSKAAIRVRLGKIMVRCPEVNPSRNTLQSVNSYLMGG